MDASDSKIDLITKLNNLYNISKENNNNSNNKFGESRKLASFKYFVKDKENKITATFKNNRKFTIKNKNSVLKNIYAKDIELIRIRKPIENATFKAYYNNDNIADNINKCNLNCKNLSLKDEIKKRQPEVADKA